MTIKEILLDVKADVGLPVTRRKIEKKGYDVSLWLGILAERMKYAEDAQNPKIKAIIESFSALCEKL